MDLLKALILVSEKAANIARVCRKNEHLIDLLVQKKKKNEANPRFIEDFKTLADVLIQEMVKHDIGKQFEALSNNIKGEENNVFRNKLGEEIHVEVKFSERETSNLLQKVLNGDRIAADLLATEVHKELELSEIRTTAIPQEEVHADLNELGIWIDPIDCTAEYITGRTGKCDHNIHVNGLKCVTILIGAFNRTTGIPVMGVINRPFLDDMDFQFSQQCVWGISIGNFIANSGMTTLERKQVICISTSEDIQIKEKLKRNGFHLIEASGAGYKILTVILGLADAYLLTKGTTFKWDTCAPQAILKTLGGDIVDFSESMRSEEKNITYFIDENNCNSNGIIAFKNRNILNEIVDILKR